MAPQQHLQTRLQFAQVKRLGQIVIGPHVQPQHPVGHVGPGRQDQDRHRIAPCTQSLQNAQTILARQLQVEQDGVKPVPGLQAAIGRQPIGRKVNIHTALAQGSAQPQGDVGRVFHQQNFGRHVEIEGFYRMQLTGV